MIHKILLWICGIASIIGIILYLIDKTSEKTFSLKLTIGLIFGGIILAIVLALTEPKDKTPISKPTNKETNKIVANNNTNSPIANKIENQTNNYYSNEGKDENPPKLKSNQIIENTAESSGQKDGVTANKVVKNKSETVDKIKEISSAKNSVKSVNQQGGITANQVNIYNEKQPLPAIELITQTLNSINPQVLAKQKTGIKSICIMAQQYKVNKLLEREKELKAKGLLQIESNGSVMNGNSNRMGDCINDIQNGSLNGFIIRFLENYKQ